MSIPGHFPLSRASTASTLVDEDLNQSIFACATPRESNIGREADSEADSDFEDFHRRGSVDALLQKTRLLLWIQYHETGRGRNKTICSCLRAVQHKGEEVVQAIISCRDIISKKNVSGDNSVIDYISAILSSK
jgi:hypothetical protein